MNTSTVPTAPEVNVLCAARWPFSAVAKEDWDGFHTAQALEASNGAEFTAELLHADAGPGHVAADDPAAANALLSQRAQDGLFSALRACLQTIEQRLHRHAEAQRADDKAPGARRHP